MRVLFIKNCIDTKVSIMEGIKIVVNSCDQSRNQYPIHIARTNDS